MQLFDRFSGSEFALNYGKVRYEFCPKFKNSSEEFSQYGKIRARGYNYFTKQRPHINNFKKW